MLSVEGGYGGWLEAREEARRRRRLDVAATGRPICSVGATLSRQPLVLASALQHGARRAVWTSNTPFLLSLSSLYTLYPPPSFLSAVATTSAVLPPVHSSRRVAAAKPRESQSARGHRPPSPPPSPTTIPPPLPPPSHTQTDTHSQHLPIALSLELVLGSVAVLVVVELLVECRTSSNLILRHPTLRSSNLFIANIILEPSS